MKLKLSQIQIITLFLGIYALLAAFFSKSSTTFITLFFDIALATTLFQVLKAITKKPKIYLNTIISALIIFIVLHGQPLGDETMHHHFLMHALAITIAVASKFFLEPKGLPIINPAVLGLLATQPFTPFVSWWGANFQGYFSLALIAIWILFFFKSWRKFPLLLTFLAAHAITLYFTQQDTAQLLYTFTRDATIYFFASIMLCEPKSSPFLKKQQIIYALIAVAIYNTLSHFNISYFELWAIFAANIYYAITRYASIPKKIA